MKMWVLIIVMESGFGTAIDHIIFDDKSACIIASQKAKKIDSMIETTCTPKGSI